MFNFWNKFFNTNKKCMEINDIADLSGKSAIFYALEGEVARKTNNFKEAIEYLSKAIEMERNNDMFYISRSLAYKSLRNYQAALEDINKALELNNNIEQSLSVKNELMRLLNN